MSMDNLISGKLNGRAILLPTEIRTYEKIENFFNSINNSKICLTLTNDTQILPTTEISSYNDLNIECFSKIFENENRIFIFHHYRKPYIYYRCKDCYSKAFFKYGKFTQKHLRKCRVKLVRNLSKKQKEVESYFNSTENTNEVSIYNFTCDSDLLTRSNNQILQFPSDLEEVKVHDMMANKVFRKSIHNLSAPTQIDFEFSILNDSKFGCDDNIQIECMNRKKQFESKIDKIKIKIRTN